MDVPFFPGDGRLLPVTFLFLSWECGKKYMESWHMCIGCIYKVPAVVPSWGGDTREVQEEALRSLVMKTIPPPCWIRSMFSKQDSYVLRKLGLTYSSSAPPPEKLEKIRSGNQIPFATEASGLRLCMAADKLTQVLAQSATAALKRLPEL